jgi:hypothetical protein
MAGLLPSFFTAGPGGSADAGNGTAIPIIKSNDSALIANGLAKQQESGTL